jgi:hypothetical protein
MHDTCLASPAPATKDDSLAANINTLIEKVNSGKSDALRTYLAAMARLTSYSFGNVLEIVSQRPNATRVAGYGTWKKLGRQVMKGAKGIRIYAPMIGVKKQTAESIKDGSASEGEKRLYGFKAVYVFDLADTDGDPLPSLSATATGDAAEHLERMLDYTRTIGIPVTFDASIAPAYGLSHGGRITLLPGMSEAETASTLAHEIAHELLHRGERRAQTTKTIRETEAEAVAFVVCSHLGITCLDAAADYVQLYNGDAATLTESFKFIHQAAKEIIDGLAVLQNRTDDPVEELVLPMPASPTPATTYEMPLAA